MRAYYFDNQPGDQRLQHDCQPSRPVDTARLKGLGVHHWRIPVAPGYEVEVDAIARERGYKNRDTIDVSKEGMGAVRLSLSLGLGLPLGVLTFCGEIRCTRRRSKGSSKSAHARFAIQTQRRGL